METNIKLCFPDKTDEERTELVKQSFTSASMVIFEMALSWWRSNEQMMQLHEIEGLEHLTNALKKGKGVILLVSHFTAMEIGGTFLGKHINNLKIVYKHSYNELFQWFSERKRIHNCAGLIRHKSLKEIVRSIKKGDVLWYAPDQDFGYKDSTFAPFMGIQTSTLLSTMRLAKITQAPVVPFFIKRDNKAKKYIIQLSPELENFPQGDDLLDATTINKNIEQQIQKAPEQYLWGHRRFKTRPKGEKDFYTKL